MILKFFFTSLLCLNAQAQLIDRIVAIVNSEIVTESDLRNFSKKIGQNNMFVDDMLLGGSRVEDLKSNADLKMNYLINEKLLAGEIKRLNLSVTIEKVEQEIRDIAKRNRMSRNELLDAIKNQGVPVSDYQDFIKNRIERQSLIQSEVSSKIRISDEDVRAQYQRMNPNLSAGVYEYTLAHIVLNPQKGVERAQKKAEDALKQLRGGQAFEQVAEQYSEDTNFTAGGLLGTFKAGEFSKDMESAVKDLNVGEISGVVKLRNGYHILKVLSKKLVTDPNFEKQREKIYGELFDKAFQKNFKLWLETKKEESFIRINSTSKTT